jgi:hypothetical protein
VRTIRARFKSTCPQCKTVLEVGTEIGCAEDKVWRCLRCTRMFDETFRETGCCHPGKRVYFLDDAASEAFNAKRKAIREKYGFTDADFAVGA